MQAIRMRRPGGPDVLEFIELPTPVPKTGEVLIEVAAAGVNFLDIGVRRGQLWADLPNPKIMGVEGAGVIVALGDGVADFRIGERVAWVYAPGSYAQQITVPVSSLVSVPEEITDKVAAAVMMQGLTASHFATDFYPIQDGDIALVHAAAGGVGLLLTQLIKRRGGRVIARVSGADKAAAARQAGAEHVIVGRDGSFADEVLALTEGEGVHVVYDGSGPATFAGSLASLRRSGTLCWFGPVLGAPERIDLLELPKSIKIGYAVYADHVSTPELLRRRSASLFDLVARGGLKVRIGAEHRLVDAMQAHLGMEARTTTGKLLLIP